MYVMLNLGLQNLFKITSRNLIVSVILLALTSWLLYCHQDSPLDITIGPYETYEDGLFGYKVSSILVFNLQRFFKILVNI